MTMSGGSPSDTQSSRTPPPTRVRSKPLLRTFKQPDPVTPQVKPTEKCSKAPKSEPKAKPKKLKSEPKAKPKELKSEPKAKPKVLSTSFESSQFSDSVDKPSTPKGNTPANANQRSQSKGKTKKRAWYNPWRWT